MLCTFSFILLIEAYKVDHKGAASGQGKLGSSDLILCSTLIPGRQGKTPNASLYLSS